MTGRSETTSFLWLKKGLNRIEPFAENIGDVFDSPVEFKESINDALNVNFEQKEDFHFKIGLAVVDKLLTTLNLNQLDLSSEITSGKQVSISYNNSKTVEINRSNLDAYLAEADIPKNTERHLKELNRKNIIIISGVLFAKNLKVEIETDFKITAELVTKLKDKADSKAEFEKGSDSKLTMMANMDSFFPIAVKAHRVDFDKNKFDKLILFTDNRGPF